jgi:hypothetical protein
VGDGGQKVGLFLAGAQKAGTTSLFTLLAQHPQLAAPHGKEPHFFDNEALAWPAPDYTPLHASYPAGDQRLRFDATPVYSFWGPAMARIHRYNAEARIILLLRDPALRALSQWRMARARGAEDLSFAEAIRAEPARLAAAPPWSLFWSMKSFAARGRYGEQLARIYAHFPRDQVLLLRAEDFFRQQGKTLAEIACFLGIASFPDLPEVHEHRGDPAHTASAEDLAAVRRLLAEDLQHFAALSGWDIGSWFAAEPAAS